MRRSAATWSRTKLPRSGWAASGSMLETTSARTFPATVALWNDGVHAQRISRIGPAWAADRRIRLGCRWPDRAARAARAAAARGFHLSGRHGPVSLRRALARGNRAFRGGDRRGALAPAREVAGGGVQLRRLLRASEPQLADAPDDARPGCGGRGAARGDTGGGGDTERTNRSARDTDDRGERRIRAGGCGGRSSRDAARGGVPDARGDHPGRRAVRRAGGGDRARGMRAAEERGRGHRDSRLHPLSVDQPPAAEDAGAGGYARQLGRGAGAPGRARAEHAPARESPRGRRG